MKTFSIVLLVVLTIAPSLGQPQQGDKELSVSGSYQNFSSGNGSESSGAVLLSPRLGFFVVQGFEIEPEVLLMAASGSDLVYVLNANISYNFIHEGTGVPFLLIGYGTANTVPIFNVPMVSTNFSVGVANVGGGVKAFIRDNVAVRVEYRFQNFSGEGQTYSFGSYAYTEKVDIRVHTVQFGLSVLL